MVGEAEMYAGTGSGTAADRGADCGSETGFGAAGSSLAAGGSVDFRHQVGKRTTSEGHQEEEVEAVVEDLTLQYQIDEGLGLVL